MPLEHSVKEFPLSTRRSLGTNLKPFGLRFFSISIIDLDYSNKMHPITVSEPTFSAIFYMSLSDHRWKSTLESIKPFEPFGSRGLLCLSGISEKAILLGGGQWLNSPEQLCFPCSGYCNSLLRSQNQRKSRGGKIFFWTKKLNLSSLKLTGCW